MTDSVLPPPIADPVSSQPGPGGEASGTSNPLARNVATEMVATTFVMLAGPGALALTSGGIGDLGAALAFGAAIAIAIGVLGAVANPIFTLALLLVREISLREAVGDWVGQFAGGILGGLLIFGINDLDRFERGANGWDRNGFGALGSVISAELIFGIVVVVVLLSSISKGFTMASIATFTGIAYAMAHLVLLDLDGGGINPARSLGAALFADTDPNALSQVWVFVLVPLVAAIGGVFVWLAIDDAEIDDTLFDETPLDDMQNRLTGDRD